MAPNATLPVRGNNVTHSRCGMKHLPFDSIYRRDFQVVEQREGRLSMFPHTEQLPVLLRALNLEFYGALPSRLARTNHRAEDYRKISLRGAALLYCNAFNAARPDGVRLFQVLDRDKVAKVAIVQQVTRHERLGRAHYFRFYAGADFFPEPFLNGKRILFSEHTLQRFSSRVPNRVGTDISEFLLAFFGSHIISLPIPHGRAFVIPYGESLLAFPYKETATEFFVMTCLTVNEIQGLKPELPTQAFNVHYDLPYIPPRVRHWLPAYSMSDLYQRYQNKVPLEPSNVVPHPKQSRWFTMAGWMLEAEKRGDNGPGAQLAFMDGIFGPHEITAKAGEKLGSFDERAFYQKLRERPDWDEACLKLFGMKIECPKELPEEDTVLGQMAA